MSNIDLTLYVKKGYFLYYKRRFGILEGKNNMTDKELNRQVLFRQTLSSLIIQTVSTIGTLVLLFFVYLQLSATRKEQAVSLRPYVNLEVEEWPGTLTQVYEMRNAGAENEIWDLGYWIRNTGMYPAKYVVYRIEHLTTDKLATGGSLDKSKAFMVAPKLAMLVAKKPIPRSEVLTYIERGERFYRHFYVQYEDNDGKQYWTSAVWVLLEYKIGNPIKWQLVTMDGN